jgi:threonine/homoserine/homoserine lactone efflux protein
VRAGLLAGGLAGLLVAAEVGPIWLLCVRSVLRHGVRVGVAIGAGAALVDGLYAALGIAGAASLLQVEALRAALGLAGALVLAAIGARSLWSAFRVRLGGETAGEVASPRRAFVTSLAATASNPLTIASWAAVFTAARTADVAATTTAAAALLVGVVAGSFAWFAALSAAVALARRRAGPRLVACVDALSGLGLLAFAALLGFRTLETPDA